MLLVGPFFALALGGAIVSDAPAAPSAQPNVAIADTAAAFDANQLRVVITNRGWIGYPPADYAIPGYEWPRGSGCSFGFAGGLWIGARVMDSTRVTVAEYTSEWTPGPLDGDGHAVDPTESDPAYHVYGIVTDDDAGNSSDYADWPAHLGAPTDSNGKPLLVGDQTLWCVFNDAVEARHHNPVGSSAPLGLEVRQTTWGYNRGAPLDQVLFVAYDLVNKGPHLLSNAYAAMWFDADLGGSSDDLVGCDTSLALGYTYNAGDQDNVYGARAPAFGCGLLQGPIVNGDTLGMHAFGRLLKNYTEPMNRDDAYWRMEKGVWDSLLIPDFHDCNPPDTRYEVSGDPVTGAGCRDTLPADRRFMWSTGPFDLAPGATQRIVAALVVGGHFGEGDRLSSITDLRVRTAAARAAYFDPPPPLPVKPTSLRRVFPNPGTGVQAFSLRVPPSGGPVRLEIYDLAGRRVWEREFNNLGPGVRRVEWDGRDQEGRKLTSAVYLARLRDGEGERTVKFVRLRAR
jgi:hypothetical protein